MTAALVVIARCFLLFTANTGRNLGICQRCERGDNSYRVSFPYYLARIQLATSVFVSDVTSALTTIARCFLLLTDPSKSSI